MRSEPAATYSVCRGDARWHNQQTYSGGVFDEETHQADVDKKVARAAYIEGGQWTTHMGVYERVHRPAMNAAAA